MKSSYQLTIEVKKPGQPTQTFTGNIVTFDGDRMTNWDHELAALLRKAADELTAQRKEEIAWAS